MAPKNFKDLVGRVENVEVPPIKESLRLAKAEVSALESSLKKQELIQTLCEYLIKGVTPAGYFGCAPHYAMFVRSYRAEPTTVAGRTRVELVEVDMVIVRDLLIQHVLRVNIPNPTDPNRSTNTSANVNVPGIVERMLKHSGYAKNVSEGTFADVLCEPCTKCGEQVPVAAFDEHVDDDNGRDFTIRRLCGACPHVEDIASYSGRYTEKDRQYCLVDGIYQH